MNKYILSFIFLMSCLFISTGCYTVSVAKNWSEPVEIVKEFDNAWTNGFLLDNIGSYHLSWLQAIGEKVNALYYLKFNDIANLGLPKKVVTFTDGYIYNRYCTALDTQNNPHFICNTNREFLYLSPMNDKWIISSMVPFPKDTKPRYYAFGIDEHNQRYLIWFVDELLYYTTSSDGVNWKEPLTRLINFKCYKAVWHKNKFHLIGYYSRVISDTLQKRSYYATFSIGGILSEIYPFTYDMLQDICVDYDGNPHIVWINENNFIYSYMQNGKWIEPTEVKHSLPGLIADLFTDEGRAYITIVQIVLDKDNHPHLVWNINLFNELTPRAGKIYYTFFDGKKWLDRWQIIKSGAPEAPLMIIDKNNIVHVIWLDRNPNMGKKISLYYSSYKPKDEKPH